MNRVSEEKTSMTSRSDSFLPNFCNIQMVFAVVISVGLLAMVLAFGNSRTLAGFTHDLSLYSLFIQWVALSGIGLLCVLKRWLCGLTSWVSGVLVWLLFLLLTLVVSGLDIYLLEPQGTDAGHLFFVLRNLAISAIVTALALRYIYLQHLWRQQIIAESQARLQSLQSRIRPHFLFNSMNTIASLTRSRPELAEEVVHDLADLFRSSLSDAQHLSTLGKELELARGYLRIESQRLGERLQVEWDLEELPLAAKMPALILQPLLENAVYHGIEPASAPGKIHIAGRYRRQRVNISIRNTLPSTLGKGHRKGNRLALENIRQRLQGCFQEFGGLTLNEVDGEHQVRLFFPHPWNE